MDGDHREIGRILSRREALALLGASATMMVGYSRERGLSASTSTLAAPETPCLVRPKQTEGPYFSDGQVERSDIRTDPSTGVGRPGVPLQLAFHVTRPRNGECLPLEGMRIDIWHCDAWPVFRFPQGTNRRRAVLAWLPGHRARWTSTVHNHISRLV